MSDLGFDLTAAFAYVGLAVLAHLAVLRRLQMPLIDPATVIAISTSFALALTLVVVASAAQALSVIAAVVAFWSGVVWGTALSGLTTGVQQPVRPHEPLSFRVVMLLSVILYLVANAYVFAVAGLPALSDEPTLAKVEIFSGGLGFIRRINWGVGTFAVFALTFQLLLRRGSRPWLLYAATIAVTALSGSKGALLSALLSLGLIGSHRAIVLPKARRRLLVRLLASIATMAAMVAVAILLIENNGNVVLAMQGLLIRLFYFGDVMFYWSNPSIRESFNVITGFDYPAHLLNPVLGALRLADYQQPFGSQFVQASVTDDRIVSELFGPNIPFYVKGELFFGPWAALVYSLCIGWLFGKLRSHFLGSRPTDPLRFCVLGSVVVMLPALALDDSLFVSQVFDLLVVLVPIVFAVKFVVDPVSKINRRHAKQAERSCA